jgi:outer membrane protein, heavy metal efflux system
MSASPMDTASQAMSKPHAINNMLKNVTICLLAASFLAGCAKEKYIAKPINPQQTSAKILAKDPLSTDFKAYLIKQGYKDSELPFASWGINELTASALFHHTKLDVAKAQLGFANAQLETAGQKQNPTLNGSLARSNQANGDIRPWAYGLNVEIPIETAGKRAIRIEEAQHLAEVARIDVAEVAWQLRSQIAKDLLQYHQNSAQQTLLQQQVEKYGEIVNMLEKRVAVGVLSNTELLSSKLLLQAKKDALTAEQAKSQEMLATLAADAGLTLDKFKQIPIKALEVETNLAKQTESLNASVFKSLQEKALLNRLDIRRSLEKYAAAEAKIKLEVAKQTPDISISPGFIFDFGDKIWSLGFSSLLNLLNTNQLNTSQTLIAEATQLREIEGAQFEALQANIIGDLSVSEARFMAAQENLAAAKQQQSAQQNYLQKLNKQFAAGAIDRLELAQADLLAQQANAQVTNSQFELLNAANTLEDLMQRPLFDDVAKLKNE